MKYILGIDQSTQGTKAILTDQAGKITGRADRAHEQIINEQGWVSHNLEEIYQNVLLVVQDVVRKTQIDPADILGIGISNQRETTALWDQRGRAMNDAVVWQCSRGKEIVKDIQDHASTVRKKTGLRLSPYFSAAKMAWLLRNTEEVKGKPESELHLGTMDSWLIYRMTNGTSFKTDYSNASRTQLFNIHTLQWDEELCDLFQIPMESLPQVCDSNALFGMTDLEGFLEKPIPIRSVMGDSHAALFGQGCHTSGMIKTTYGTGSSIMMNTGENCVASRHGLVTSLAWGIDGNVHYVLEGNINYTGAVITWLKDDLKLINNPGETAEAAMAANPLDSTVLVPAFSGLSAPYWDDRAKALIYGMTRMTGRNEIIKASLESIALQIQAVLSSMKEDSGMSIQELRVDGGPTRNPYLMQIQSDLADTDVAISQVEELSALGVAYLAGISQGFYEKEALFGKEDRVYYHPNMDADKRNEKIENWRKAVQLTRNA